MTSPDNDPTPRLDPRLVRTVRERIGLNGDVPVSLAGLSAFYEAWAQNVPFCSIQKRLHVATAAPGDFPGANAEDYLADYLTYGTGGTCFSAGEGIYQMLRALGFPARRVAATMLEFAHLPGINHGSVLVELPEGMFLVDPFFNSEHPLPLGDGETAAAKYEPRTVRATAGEDGYRWVIRWRFPFASSWLRCAIAPGDVGVPRTLFHERYRASAGPANAFNQGVFISINRGPEVHALYKGAYHVRVPDSPAISHPVDLARRNELLETVFGISPAIIGRLPADAAEPEPLDAAG
jgi:N-hydroxyarylamine O-acetyltransferase